MGALGRVHGNGDLELALTIRTFAIADGCLHLWAGGGIVWDSEPVDEIAESLTKAAPLLEAIEAPLERARKPTGWREDASACIRRGPHVSAAPLAVAVSGRGLVDPELPTVRVDDEAVSRGRAAFETLRVYDGKPFRLAEHVERMRRSASMLGLPLPEPTEVTELAGLALGAGQTGGDVVLRLYWTPGPPEGDPLAIAVVSLIPSWIEDVRLRGQRLASLAFPRRSAAWLLPGTKSTSYATHLAAEAEARRRGADDAVLVDLDGTVLEGTVTNVWWREGGDALHAVARPRHPRRRDPCCALRGLRRGRVRGSRKGRYPLARLLAADEVFTSSSVREVMPASAVDETLVRSGTGGGAAPGRAARAGALTRSATLRGVEDIRRARDCVSAGWRSATACSCTGRPALASRSETMTARS